MQEKFFLETTYLLRKLRITKNAPYAGQIKNWTRLLKVSKAIYQELNKRRGYRRWPKKGYMVIVKEMEIKYGIADEGREHENAKGEYGN